MFLMVILADIRAGSRLVFLSKNVYRSSSFENKPIIKDKVYASGDSYTNGYVEKVEDPPFFKNCKENDS